MSERDRWQERHRARPERGAASPFVARHAEQVARSWPGARALDLACGSGRHTLLLARHGFRTTALDHALVACQRLAADAPDVETVAADAAALPFRATSFALIVQTRFLDRAIVPDLVHLLVRGGLLVIETFLVAQHETTGHPRREFCLVPGELETLCRSTGQPIEVVDRHEGAVQSGGELAHLAGVAVCKV